MGAKEKYKVTARRLPSIAYDKRKNEFRATWEPGDGTKYDLWARRIFSIDSFGCLGSVTEGWMIVCALNGRAYLFQRLGVLDTEYVAEHLGLDNAVSALKITALIGFALERETDVEVRIEQKDSPGQKGKPDDN